MTALTAPVRHAFASVLLIGSLLITSACTKKDQSQAGSPTPSAETQVSASADPGASTDPTAQASPGAGQPSKTSGGGSTAPTYPKDAKGYGLALLGAWKSNDRTRIDQLAVQAAVQQVKDYGALPDLSWTTFHCDVPDLAYTVCVYHSANGDVATVRMTNTQLGHPTAVTEAQLTKTYYPAAAGDYVSAFIDAWRDGNVARMNAMTTSTAAAFFKNRSPATGYTVGGTDGMIHANALPLGSGDSYVFTVSLSKLGKPDAITAVKVE